MHGLGTSFALLVCFHLCLISAYGEHGTGGEDTTQAATRAAAAAGEGAGAASGSSASAATKSPSGDDKKADDDKKTPEELMKAANDALEGAADLLAADLAKTGEGLAKAVKSLEEDLVKNQAAIDKEKEANPNGSDALKKLEADRAKLLETKTSLETTAAKVLTKMANLSAPAQPNNAVSLNPQASLGAEQKNQLDQIEQITKAPPSTSTPREEPRTEGPSAHRDLPSSQPSQGSGSAGVTTVQPRTKSTRTGSSASLPSIRSPGNGGGFTPGSDAKDSGDAVNPTRTTLTPPSTAAAANPTGFGGATNVVTAPAPTTALLSDNIFRTVGSDTAVASAAGPVSVSPLSNNASSPQGSGGVAGVGAGAAAVDNQRTGFSNGVVAGVSTPGVTGGSLPSSVSNSPLVSTLGNVSSLYQPIAQASSSNVVESSGNLYAQDTGGSGYRDPEPRSKFLVTLDVAPGQEASVGGRAATTASLLPTTNYIPGIAVVESAKDSLASAPTASLPVTSTVSGTVSAPSVALASRAETTVPAEPYRSPASAASPVAASPEADLSALNLASRAFAGSKANLPGAGVVLRPPSMKPSKSRFLDGLKDDISNATAALPPLTRQLY